MPVRALLMDIDDTLFDFHRSSHAAIADACRVCGVPFSEAFFARYEAVDAGFWQRFERGEIEKETLYIERFRVLFAEFSITADPAAFNAAYFDSLGRQRYFMPHCEQVLPILHEKYRIFIVTNGKTDIQLSRIAVSGVEQYFDGVFISEQMDCKKPDRLFFDKVFATIGEELRPDSVIIGDSLTSDMQGGRNAGIRTCLYGSPSRADGRCDYAIEDLLALPALFARL